MWTCTACREMHGDDFDACWKCGAARQDEVPTSLPETENVGDQETLSRADESLWPPHPASGSAWTLFFFTLAAISAGVALIGAISLFPEESVLSLPKEMYYPSIVIFSNGITMAVALFAVGDLARRVHALEAHRSGT